MSARSLRRRMISVSMASILIRCSSRLMEKSGFDMPVHIGLVVGGIDPRSGGGVFVGGRFPVFACAFFVALLVFVRPGIEVNLGKIDGGAGRLVGNGSRVAS